MHLFFVFIGSLLVTTHSLAEEFYFESGDRQNTLVELYTSEGCNSCPPAERYLNSFTKQAALWQRYVPLAFHVDYWDYLGWKDRFAQKKFAQRQYDYAQTHKARTVYTPAFFVNGDRWRPGFAKNDTPPISKINIGSLRARVAQNTLHAEFKPIKTFSDLELHVAILGMGLSSDIRAGENEGTNPTHDFVVLAHEAHKNMGRRWKVMLPKTANIRAKQFGIAIWVSTPSDPTPLQATGGFLPVSEIQVL